MQNKSKCIYTLSFLLPVVIVILGFIPNQIFPFGEKGLLYADGVTQYIPFLSYFKSVLTTNNDFFYSFSLMGGSPIFDFSAFYLFSPLNFFLFLFPNEYLQIGVEVTMVLRLGFIGLTFAYLLNKVFGYRTINILFAVTYALCGYNIFNFTRNYYMMDSIILLPIVIVGIINIIKYNKPKLYILALTFSIIFNAFTGYIIILFSFLFFIYQLLLNSDYKNCFRSIKNYSISTLLSIGLTSWIIIPVSKIIQNNKYDFFDNSFFYNFFEIRVDFFTILSKFFDRTMILDYWLQELTPQLFVGIFVFLLLILYFINNNIHKRDRLITGFFLGFLIISLMFNSLFVIWNMGVENPSCSVYRYGFIVIFFIFYLAYQSFVNIPFLKIKEIILGAIIFSFIIGSVYYNHYYYMDNNVLMFDYIYGICIFLVIYLAYKFIKLKEFFLFLLIFCHIINIFNNINLTFKYHFADPFDPTFLSKTYTEKYKLFNKAVQYIKNIDNSFYKIETNENMFKNNEKFFPYFNMGFLYNFNSISSYTSCGNINVFDFYTKIGFLGMPQHVNLYHQQDSILFPLSLMNVKYIISYKKDFQYPYERIQSFSDNKQELYVYKNNLVIPNGIFVNKNILENDYRKEDFRTLKNYIIKSLAEADYGDVYEYKEISIKDLSDKKCVYQITEKICSNYNIYLLVMPKFWKYITNIKIFNQNKKILLKELDIHFHNQMSYIGNYLNKDNIKMIFDIQVFGNAELNAKEFRQQKMFLVNENLDTLKKYINKIQQNSCNIEKITSSHIKCSYYVKEDNKLLLLTIPFDNGWHAKIDGKKIGVIKAYNALMAIPLDKGFHTIELRYFPPELTKGIIISIISLVFLLLYYKKE